ncbi:diguanylate cyclase [Paenibacillus sp. NFR01]|uniref:diguanylate cyclase n=1 Tax=Paenibacillus sp. NFR01 TaxID=1566279 RepID=UPI0008C6DBBF|nr:diguanylate cyclase [Paenibacillus sp. NFR01]SET45939.1 PAS domain S-box-containing protein/diguanylate cyclase (GGDEF) domain-containing protein [Paenibacillus sp. NFR01]
MIAFDNYQILETISDNPLKAVYRCRTAEGMTVILKVLRAELASPETVIRFKQEYRLLQELGEALNGGVITPISLEEQNGYYLMVLQDIHGRSLKHILAEEKPDAETLLRLAVRLVDILGAIHERDIIHKDIKPANIIWNRHDDIVQIIDFDLAVKLSKKKREHQSTGVLEGSLSYISPEQTGRMNRDIDYRSDYYSFGAVLYEMMTGQRPFPAAGMTEQIYAIIAKEPVPPDRLTGGKVPGPLSAVIMKLLEKSADDRYRSAYGIRADLQKCLYPGEPFELAAEDRLYAFRLPQQLYGREAEAKRLLQAFRANRAFAERLMLVSGEAGVGKTAFVREMHRYVGTDKGLFAEGKFEQYTRNMPLGALIQAFRRLLGELAASGEDPEAGAEELRESVAASLGGNAGLLTGLIPELGEWLGLEPQLERQPLNPAEEANRFYLTLTRLIEGLTGGVRPLMLFLDDIHWADGSTLQLVQRLAQDSSLHGLFIVLAYRGSELAENAAAEAAIAVLQSAGAGSIELKALTAEDVRQYVADIVYREPDEVRELADLVYRRTQGNALYLGEFMKLLQERDVLEFNELEGAWIWRLDDIAALPASDNVVHFLMDKLGRLPEHVRSLLVMGAALGGVFERNLLAIISQEPAERIEAALQRAMDEEIIVGLETHLPEGAGQHDPAEQETAMLYTRFKFVHDRIQQAFYQMYDPQRIKALHLTIGRRLLAGLKEEAQAERLVEIASHFNHGAEQLHGEEEREALVRMNLQAAEQAKAAFGYDSAYALLRSAIRLLPADIWHADGELAAKLHTLYAECAYLNHRLLEGDEACAELLRRSGDKPQRAGIYEMQATHYMYLGMMQEAITAGRNGLRELGVSVPQKVTMVAVLKELVKVKAALRGRNVKAILNAPEMADPELKRVMRLLINFIPPAFISGETALFGFVVLKKVGLSLKHGISPESALAFIGYAMLLSGFGDVKGAYEFGRLGVTINDKFGDRQWRSASRVLYTLFSHVWTEPWSSLKDWFGSALTSGLQNGDLLYLAHAAYYIHLWNPEMEIAAFLQESDRMIGLIGQTKYKEALATAKLARQYHRGLAGLLTDSLSFDGEDFSEQAYLEELEAANYYSGVAIFHIHKMKQFFAYERYHEAQEHLARANGVIGTLAGSAFMEEYSLYAFLNMAGGYESMGFAARRRARAKMRKELGRVRKWAAHAPGTFRQHELLMRAEWARIGGKADDAGRLYQQAIAACEESGFVRYKALAHELAAKFYAGRGMEGYAAYLLKQSIYYYSVWGAKAKVRFLREHYPQLTGVSEYKVAASGRSLSDHSESIDLQSVMQASQAISKEIELDQLLAALMEIVIKTAGAQRGCIRMTAAAGLAVEGEYRPEEDKIAVTMHHSREVARLPMTLIRRVEADGQTVVLNDAYAELDLANDPYIAEEQPKSVICMPLINQNKTVAVIYLENNLLRGAFTEERIKVINLLSREMVFSLENASLYSELERSEEKYRALVHHMQDGIFISQDQKCKYVNQMLADMLGYGLEEMIGMPFDTFLSPDERSKVMGYYADRLNGIEAPQEYETRLLHKNGQREIIVIHKVTMTTFQNRPAIQGTVKDITLRKQAEEELRKHKEHLEDLVAERTRELELNNQELNRYIHLIERISITDELTGLYNRRYFNQTFREQVSKAKLNNSYLGYLMMDIDDFKKYNDTYGHYEGDNVLRRVGTVLHALAAAGDAIAFRLGGEEFGILAPGYGPQQAAALAETIRQGIEALQIEHKQSAGVGRVTMSIGVAAVQVGSFSEEDIYKLGDDALYRSKTQGRNRVTLSGE